MSPLNETASRPIVFERRRYEPLSPQETFIVPLLRREIESCIAKYATPPLGARKSVDIGCGGQPFRSLLEQIGYSYCGVDVNSTEAEMDVICAADEALPDELLRRGPFDFILCTEVVEHLADWETAFTNFSLLLAPGGRALLTAPFFYPLHEEPYDFWRPTLHSLDYYARRSGLKVLHRDAAGDTWAVLGTMLGSCSFVPSSMGLVDRLCASAVRFAARTAFRMILRGALQRRVVAKGLFYLSNVVILEQPR